MKALINCAALVKGGGRLKACVGMGGGREANRSAKKKKASNMKIEMASRWISRICGVECLAGVSIYALIF